MSIEERRSSIPAPNAPREVHEGETMTEPLWKSIAAGIGIIVFMIALSRLTEIVVVLFNL